MRGRLPAVLAAILMLLMQPFVAVAQPRPQAESVADHVPDLADQLAGSYRGDVISDARGTSRSDVAISVTRTGRNMIRVASDYARIPTVSITLTRAMDSIVAASGPHVAFVNLASDPDRLDLTIDDASWSGRKIGAR